MMILERKSAVDYPMKKKKTGIRRVLENDSDVQKFDWEWMWMWNER